MQNRDHDILSPGIQKRTRDETPKTFSKKTKVSPPPSLKSPEGQNFRSLILQNGDGKAFWYFKSLSYEINNYRAYIESPFFETANGNEWSILLWPSKSQGYMGLYVHVKVPMKDYNYRKKVTVYFETYLTINKLERKVTQNFTDDFTFSKRDWGYEKYIKLSDYHSALNKPIVFEVTVSPHRPHEDSKMVTGYNGIYNEGTTCYINSLLQTLFFLSCFRKSVYLMPTSEKDTDRIPLALQFIFYHLQCEKTPASTRDLLKSFGWNSEQWHVQHDVQEFNCILSDTLEKKMKGTPSEGTYSKIFIGKMRNFIQCSEVNYRSERFEHFSDLQLNVKGCSNLYESFERYVEVEVLDGDNKYEAEGHGKQVATRGVIFEYFPPVLQLQLKRFEYDYQLDRMLKLNQFYEFEQTIDLSKYVEGSGDWTYSLFSILVHRGNAQAGHYFSYISPKLDGNWYIFNDDSVDHVLTSQALQSSFGGKLKELDIDENGFVRELLANNETCAYMLVYIRADRANDILAELTIDDIPKSLQQIFEGELNKKTKEDKAKELKESLTFVYLTADEILHGWDWPGITNPESDNYELPKFTSNDKVRAKIEIKKNAKGNDLFRAISQHYKEPIKLWVFTPGFKNWEFTELNSSESLIKQVNDKAVFIETSRPVFEYTNKWEFINYGNLSPCSQNTEILDDSIDIKPKALLVLKWYEWNDGNPQMTLLKVDSLIISDLEALRQSVFYAKYGQLNDYNKPVQIYIEKSSKILKDSPDIKKFDSKCNYKLLPYSASVDKSNNKVLLDNGDCIIGEILEENQEGYYDAALYIEQKYQKVHLNLIYCNKLGKFGFNSFSSDLFKNDVPSCYRVSVNLRDSEEVMIEELIMKIGLKSRVSVDQIELLTEDNGVFTTLPRDFKRTIDDLLAHNKQFFFDIMPEMPNNINDFTVVYALLVDHKFKKLHQYCKVLPRPTTISTLENCLFNDIMENLGSEDVKQVRYYLLNYPQQCIVKELDNKENIEKYVTQSFSLICLRAIQQEEIIKEINQGKLFLYIYHKDEEKGYSEVYYYNKTATFLELSKQISARFEEKVRVLTCEKKIYGERFEIKPGRLLEDSEEIFVHKYSEKYVAVELPSLGISKNQLKIFRD